MAFSPTPSSWIPGYTVSGGNITIPVSSLSGLDTTEATNDIRKFLRALNQTVYAKWQSLASADRPAQMSVSRSSYENATTGTMHRSYTTEFNVGFTGEEVEDEPTA